MWTVEEQTMRGGERNKRWVMVMVVSIMDVHYMFAWKQYNKTQ
jgi:hypothetical protein